MRESQSLLLLDRDQVERLLEPGEVIAAVRSAFVLHSTQGGRVFPVVREPLATGGVFGIKSGDVAAQKLLGFKAAGFWPANRAVGGEPHQATIVLIDPTNGRPLCLLDGNIITTMRTGAAGGLGLDALAPPAPVQVCLFGTGVQARIQLTFALRFRPMLKRVQYLTANGMVDDAFESAFRESIEISHAKDADAAVSASDLIITATPGGGPLFRTEAVKPGTHLTCVGADTKGKRELPAGLLARARVFVDDRAQARELGELQWIGPETLSTELGELLAGKVSFSRRDEDITVFDMTGLALQDLTVSRRLYELAVGNSVGISVAWPW
jgi:alanine dehydrogenase